MLSLQVQTVHELRPTQTSIETRSTWRQTDQSALPAAQAQSQTVEQQWHN
jgi:hypothetical protein